MDVNSLVIISNIIPGLLIACFVIDGWNKGALAMLINLFKFIVSYYLTRLISSIIANTLLSMPLIKTQISNIALNYSENLNKMFGIIVFLTGKTLQSNLESMAWWLLYGISFIIIFLLMSIFFSIIIKISIKANKIPVVGKANKIIGSLEGLIFGTLITLLLIYICAFILEIAKFPDLAQVLQQSWLPSLFVRLIK